MKKLRTEKAFENSTILGKDVREKMMDAGYDERLTGLIEEAGRNLGYKPPIKGKLMIYQFLRGMWDGKQLCIPGEKALNATPTQLVALVRGYLLQFHNFEPVAEFDPPLRSRDENIRRGRRGKE